MGVALPYVLWLVTVQKVPMSRPPSPFSINSSIEWIKRWQHLTQVTLFESNNRISCWESKWNTFSSILTPWSKISCLYSCEFWIRRLSWIYLNSVSNFLSNVHIWYSQRAANPFIIMKRRSTVKKAIVSFEESCLTCFPGLIATSVGKFHSVIILVSSR